MGAAWLAYGAGHALSYIPLAHRAYQWLMWKSSALDTEQKIWTPVKKVEGD